MGEWKIPKAFQEISVSRYQNFSNSKNKVISQLSVMDNPVYLPLANLFKLHVERSESGNVGKQDPLSNHIIKI